MSCYENIPAIFKLLIFFLLLMLTIVKMMWITYISYLKLIKIFIIIYFYNNFTKEIKCNQIYMKFNSYNSIINSISIDDILIYKSNMSIENIKSISQKF